MSTFTYDDTEPTDKDRVRGLIGDIKAGAWLPAAWLLSNESISATLGRYPNNFWEGAAQCALKAGRSATSAYRGISQGHRLKIEYNSIDAVWKVFQDMATEFRNNMQPPPGQPTNPGAIAGPMDSLAYDPESVGECATTLDGCW